MEQLTLVWEGPLEMMMETPEKLSGKPGLYAIVHDSNTIYIGKAQYSNAVFREAKNRENKWIKCLREKGIISETMLDLAPYEYVQSHCRIYVGMMSDGQRLDLLGDAEKLLIYKIQPLCNKQHKKKYKGGKPFLVTNNGNRPQDLQVRIRYPDACMHGHCYKFGVDPYR